MFVSAIPRFCCSSRTLLRLGILSVCGADVEPGALGIIEPDFDGIAIVVIAWCLLLRFRKSLEEIDKELIFEENAPAAFELLDLGRGT